MSVFDYDVLLSAPGQPARVPPWATKHGKCVAIIDERQSLAPPHMGTIPSKTLRHGQANHGLQQSDVSRGQEPKYFKSQCGCSASSH